MNIFSSARSPSLLGIQIRLHWTWFLLLLYLSWILYDFYSDKLPEHRVYVDLLLAIGTALGFLLSVLLHELSHSLVARRYGFYVKGITLWIFGGVAQLADDAADMNYNAEFKITIAGPLSSFILAGVFLGSAVMIPLSPVLYYPFVWLGSVNLVLAVFNLMPCFPMDGGRILRAFLWGKTESLLRATEVVYRLRIIVGVSLIMTGFFWGGVVSALWIGFIVWFVIFPMAEAEYATVKLKERLKDVLVRDVMHDPILPPLISEALRGARHIMRCSPEDTLWSVVKRLKEEKADIILVCDGDKVIGDLEPSKIRSYLEKPN